MITNQLWSVPSILASNRMHPAFSELFESAPRGSVRQEAQRTPALDVWETQDTYGVDLEVPGFEMEQLEVTFNSGELAISGSRPSEKCKVEGATYWHRERRECSFRRVVKLPEGINTDGINAHLSGGVLRITLPKAEQIKPRKINVSQ